MVKQRKSDETRLKEGRGLGRGICYKPWIKIHELPDEGLASRMIGWKVRRIYQLLSNLERDYFFNTQWEDSVIDIREQYPLLSLEETIQIANEYGIKHPYKRGKVEKTIVMTTDFVVTVDIGNEVRDVARTIKPIEKLNERVKEKFMIEEVYWNRRNINWGIVTDKEIDQIKARNIRFLYNFYFWNESFHFADDQLNALTYKFCDMLEANRLDVLKTASEIDILMGWELGEGISFFKYLLAHKRIRVDMKADITQFLFSAIEFSF